jgi:hypothetical protein
MHKGDVMKLLYRGCAGSDVIASENRSPDASRIPLRVDHPVQMGQSIRNIVVFVLRCSAFSRHNAAPADVLELSIRKPACSFRVIGFLIIGPKVRYGVLVKPVQRNESFASSAEGW